jgi:hypothetical protein
VGNFTTEDQWVNQEQDGKALSRGMHYRSQDYATGGEELRMGKNGGRTLSEDRA